MTVSPEELRIFAGGQGDEQLFEHVLSELERDPDGEAARLLAELRQNAQAVCLGTWELPDSEDDDDLPFDLPAWLKENLRRLDEGAEQSGAFRDNRTLVNELYAAFALTDWCSHVRPADFFLRAGQTVRAFNAERARGLRSQKTTEVPNLAPDTLTDKALSNVSATTEHPESVLALDALYDELERAGEPFYTILVLDRFAGRTEYEIAALQGVTVERIKFIQSLALAGLEHSLTARSSGSGGGTSK